CLLVMMEEAGGVRSERARIKRKDGKARRSEKFSDFTPHSSLLTPHFSLLGVFARLGFEKARGRRGLGARGRRRGGQRRAPGGIPAVGARGRRSVFAFRPGKPSGRPWGSRLRRTRPPRSPHKRRRGARGHATR